MKKKFEAEYFLFAGKARPFIMLLMLIVISGICFLMAAALWQVSLIIAPILGMAVLSFMDYFVFAGFNSRKSIGMDMMKSSNRGRAIIVEALKQDIVNKVIFMFLASTIAMTEALVLNPGIEDILFVIVYGIAGFASGVVLLNAVLLLDRAKGLTMQTHILICYLFYSVGSLAILPLIFISEQMSVPLMSAYAAVALIIAVILSVVMVKSCIRAFDSSFHDAPESAA